MAPKKHIVTQGECMASIAAMYTFDWHTIWNHPNNVSLKETRKDPNVLYPGDTVFIPDKEIKNENCVTEAHHKFTVKGIPEVLRIRLLDGLDHPLTGVAYELVVGSSSFKGITDNNGELKERIPPSENESRLFLGEERREIILRLGALDPDSEISGVQARLSNLGYDVGKVDGIMGECTKQAVRDFQGHQNLEPSGEITKETVARLKDLHGR